MNENQISNFLIVFEGLAAIFLGSFLTAYLLGLPTDIVYHSDPTLRMILSIFGGFFIILILIGFIVSKMNKKKDKIS